MILEERQSILERIKLEYPFITYLQYNDTAVIGIVQNATPSVVNIFDFDRVRGIEAKRRFMEYGARWWFGSNTKIPIDLFIGDRFDEFRHCLVGYSRKEIIDITGPTVSVRDLYAGRIKRRKIEFLKRA